MNDACSSKKLKNGSMLNFVGRKSLNEIIAKCAAMDGFSIIGITFSEAIRGLVKVEIITCQNAKQR